MVMQSIPIGPGFGAEVRGVTIQDVVNEDAVYKDVRAAFEEHSVLVFRGQQVDNDSQLAFSRRFGEPEVTKVGSLGTGTHFITLTTIGTDGKVVPADHRYALRNKANQLWHTDSSFKRIPALTSILSARIVPDHGGETESVSMRLAFERLPTEQQKRFSESWIWHDYNHSRSKIAPGLASAEERAALPPVCHRMVWTNPVNGRKALYLASHAYAIEGMEPEAGRKLIEQLTADATASGLTYAHKWKNGDVVMWDNRATMHRGRPWPAKEPRLMVRTTISAGKADGVDAMQPPPREAAE
jgi:alpha-ketoglutarate-dependent 2,4-dichlorophenoxyacetate dioxygenase